MLTNNFYALFKGFGLSGGYNNTNLYMTKYDGAKINYYPIYFSTSNFYFNHMEIKVGNISTCGIYLGKSNNPATPEDYSLKNIITSGVQCTWTSKNVLEYNEELDEYFHGHAKSISVYCSSNSGMTIGEIGWYAYYNNNTFLLDRTTFETPIVLEYQNTCVIDYTIMNKISLAKLGQ